MELICELRTRFRLGGTYRGLYRALGGPTKGYITNLVQGSCVVSLFAWAPHALSERRPDHL